MKTGTISSPSYFLGMDEFFHINTNLHFHIYYVFSNEYRIALKTFRSHSLFSLLSVILLQPLHRKAWRHM